MLSTKLSNHTKDGTVFGHRMSATYKNGLENSKTSLLDKGKVLKQAQPCLLLD